MYRIILSAIVVFFFNAATGQVAINTDGTPVTDTASMLEIKKISLAKVRIRSTNYVDTSQLEFSNRNSTKQGTNYLFSLNREEGMLISSLSDISTRTQDSILAFKFSSGRTYFGMNIKNPTSVLHIHDHSSSSTTLRITNNTTGVIGINGLALNINANNASLVNAESGALNFGTNNISWGGFTSTGNFGLGTFSPSEKLGIVGNIALSGSNKGIILDAQDRPLITRGFDAFTSGSYNGLGRWGVFMEPSTLTFGIPNVTGKSFAFSKYSVSSVPEKVLTITNTGEINRPSTGSANLLPIAYGTVDGTTGAILNGTGNFSVTRHGPGHYSVSISGETYTNADFSSQVSVCSDGTSTMIKSFPASGNMVVSIVSYNGINTLDRVFCFTVYKPG